MGKIIVDKVTDPASDPTSFEFTPSWTSNFFLADLDPPEDSGWLLPGSYSVGEIVPTGWTLISAVTDDDDGSDPGTITLDPGETVTATFTNETEYEFKKEFTLLSVGDNTTWTAPWLPIGEVIVWNVTFTVPNDSGTDWTGVILTDHFGAELDIHSTDYWLEGGPFPGSHTITTSIPSNPKNVVPDGNGVALHYSKAKNMPQLRVTWFIDTLGNGEVRTLSFEVATRPNPAEHQEYTSCGLHILNSGATLKWKPVGGGPQDSLTTPSWYVFVWDGPDGEGCGPISAIVVMSTDFDGELVSGKTFYIDTNDNDTIDIGVDDDYVTDDHGFYYFAELSPGTYDLMYKPTGDGTTIVGVTVEDGEYEEVILPYSSP